MNSNKTKKNKDIKNICILQYLIIFVSGATMKRFVGNIFVQLLSFMAHDDFKFSSISKLYSTMCQILIHLFPYTYNFFLHYFFYFLRNIIYS